MLICFDMSIGLLSASHEEKYHPEHMYFDIPSIPVLGSIFKDRTYDYIVVGAGTAGMTIGRYSQQFPLCQVE
jgi:hypothetical protein